jgi:hypothetical protein
MRCIYGTLQALNVVSKHFHKRRTVLKKMIIFVLTEYLAVIFVADY